MVVRFPWKMLLDAAGGSLFQEIPSAVGVPFLRYLNRKSSRLADFSSFGLKVVSRNFFGFGKMSQKNSVFFGNCSRQLPLRRAHTDHLWVRGNCDFWTSKKLRNYFFWWIFDVWGWCIIKCARPLCFSRSLMYPFFFNSWQTYFCDSFTRCFCKT